MQTNKNAIKNDNAAEDLQTDLEKPYDWQVNNKWVIYILVCPIWIL